MTAIRPIDILLVEDNPADARLTLEAFKESRLRNTLHHVEDGDEALDFLNCRGRFADAPKPDLILLDLNLPRITGVEVLKEIKESESLRHIPVIVLTTSDAEEDILTTYRLHANAYVTKPIDLGDFLSAIQSIEGFWMSIVRLPPH